MVFLVHRLFVFDLFSALLRLVVLVTYLLAVIGKFRFSQRMPQCRHLVTRYFIIDGSSCYVTYISITLDVICVHII
jgi:hypothetical protein